jgi:hypothetical protein
MADMITTGTAPLTAPPIQCRLFITKGDHLLMVTEYTTDKDAAIEACDNINGHKKFDLRAALDNDQIVLTKNGNVLVRDRMIRCRPVMEVRNQLVEIITTFNYHKGKGLRARIDIAAASDNAIEKSGANQT